MNFRGKKMDFYKENGEMKTFEEVEAEYERGMTRMDKVLRWWHRHSSQRSTKVLEPSQANLLGHIMKRLLPVACLALTLACGKGVSEDTYLYSYQLVIDPSFTPSEVQDIMNGARNWENVVPVTFTWTVGTCDNGPNYGQVCVSQAPTSFPPTETIDGGVYDINGVCYMGGPIDHIYMYQRSETSGDSFFTQVFQHEVGHAQGLYHHAGCNVMNAILTGCAVTPSEDDIDQWWSVYRPLVVHAGE